MATRTAACHCGRVELCCEGEPKKVSMCHCLDCQRRTGSLFSIAVFFLREQIAVTKGEPAAFERASASGFPVKFHFCRDCGTNLYWEPARLPLLAGVAVGAFGDPQFPRPEQVVWTQDQHDWLVLPDDIPAFERNPPSRPAPT
jgi:hypothetical protein